MRFFGNGVSGQVVCDSISPEGIRLTTIHVRYPRMVHSEVMTHRVFSRNGRSSRAVPVVTLLKEEHYTPHFMKNQPGMVATEELDDDSYLAATLIWEDLVRITKEAVAKLNELKVHKQWANRPLEWFGYIDVLITSTDWANFLALRDDSGAQPEIDSLGKCVRALLETSEPTLLQPGQWHLPYIDLQSDIKAIAEFLPKSLNNDEWGKEVASLLRKISTARCARLSIRPFDGDSSIEKELARYDKLVVSRPVHASPAEHIATPDKGTHFPEFRKWLWQTPHEHGNFYGWRQYRKLIPYNTVEDR